MVGSFLEIGLESVNPQLELLSRTHYVPKCHQSCFERFVRLEHLSLGVSAFDRGERHALRVGSVESLVVLARSAGGFEIILRNRPV